MIIFLLFLISLNSNMNHHVASMMLAEYPYKLDIAIVFPSIPIGIQNENDACMEFTL